MAKTKFDTYMAVTNDRYELPLAVFDTAEELAEWAGLNRNTIFVACERGSVSKQDKTCKFIRLNLREKENLEIGK